MKNYCSSLFTLYNKLSKVIYLPHQLTINFSIILTNKFNPDLFITYIYDTKSYFNVVYIPFKLLEQHNVICNFTREYDQLKFFDPQNDFVFEVIPNSPNNSRYIKHVKNPDIERVSTQQYILKSISRWIIVDPNDNTKIKAVYKTKDEIPVEQRNLAIEVVAKPKIIVRLFRHTKERKVLIHIARHFYNVDDYHFVIHKSKFEFARNAINSFIELKVKDLQ